VCAPVVRQRRAEEIDRGLSGWVGQGHGAEFVTLTVEHKRGDSLASRLDVVAQLLQKVLMGAGWQRRRDRLGYVGCIRAIDVTWGGDNGWHPHVHAVLLLDRTLTVEQRADLRTWLFGRMVCVAERVGFGAPSERHAVDVQPVTSPADLGGYLTKVDGGWSAGLELSRGDVKHARSAGRLTPVGILREFIDTGEKTMRSLWVEWEKATFGKRAIVWSPGLRARLLGDELEATDEDLAASEGVDLALLRAIIPGGEWRQTVQVGEAGALLTLVEQQAGLLLLLSDSMGHDPPPLRLPWDRQRFTLAASGD
jgi:hypothetical protein